MRQRTTSKLALALAPELTLPPDAVTKKFDFIGTSGAGKSYGGMRLAELMLGIHAQVVAIDGVGNWWSLRAGADGKSAGLPIFVFGGDHKDFDLHPKAGAQIADILVEHGISAVLDLSELTTPEQKGFVAAFADRLLYRKRRSRSPLHVFFEEGQDFAPQQMEGKEDVRVLATVERLCKVGRNYGIGWSFLTQQPQAANKRVINLADTVFAMRTGGPQERSALVKWLREKVSSKTKDADLDALLSELETGIAQVWSPSFLGFSGLIHISRRTTFDVSKTPAHGEVRAAPVLRSLDVEEIRRAMSAFEVRTSHDAGEDKLLRTTVARLQRELAEANQRLEQGAGLSVEKVRAAQAQLLQFQEKSQEVLQQLHGWMMSIFGPLLDLDVPRVPMPVVHAPVPHVERKLSSRRLALAPGLDTSGLAKVERAMLSALAMHDPNRLSRVQLSLWTGYSIKSSSFTNGISGLRSKGYIEEDGQKTFDITRAGLEAVPWLPNKVPHGTKQMRSMWYEKLNKCEREFFTALEEVWPHALDDKGLEQRTEYSPTSSSFTNAKSHLHSLGLIEKRPGKQVKLRDELYQDLMRPPRG